MSESLKQDILNAVTKKKIKERRNEYDQSKILF